MKPAVPVTRTVRIQIIQFVKNEPERLRVQPADFLVTGKRPRTTPWRRYFLCPTAARSRARPVLLRRRAGAAGLVDQSSTKPLGRNRNRVLGPLARRSLECTVTRRAASDKSRRPCSSRMMPGLGGACLHRRSASRSDHRCDRVASLATGRRVVKDMAGRAPGSFSTLPISSMYFSA
jgi:hypothetical protein